MKHYIAILLFLGALHFPLSAQLPEYQAQVFGEEYGLGGGNFFDAFVDQKQFVWVSTSSNVQRFDGKTVKKYPFQDNVSFAMCAADGRIWVIAGQSVWRNRPERDDFVRISFDTTGKNYIRGIFQMKQQPLMLLATQGLYAWEDATSAFVRLNIAVPDPGGRQAITRIDTSENTLFYSAKNGGVNAFDIQTGLVRHVDYGNEFNQIFALTPDLGILTAYGQESFWMDFKKGELRLIDAREYGLSKTSFKMFLTGCTPLGNGRFLMNTKYGIYEYNLNTDHFDRKRIFAGGKPISEEFAMARIFTDNNGTAWAVTNTSLVAMQPSANSIGLLRNYHFEPPLQWDNRTYSITEDNDGNIWLSGLGGLKKLNLSTGDVKIYPNKEGALNQLSHPFVRGLSWDGENVLIGPTLTGVWLFNPKTEKYRRPAFVADSVAQAMGADYIDYIGAMRNGDHIVCGRFNLYRIEAGTNKTEIIHFPGDRDNMNSVMQDSDGRVWLSTEKGVICLDEQYKFQFSVPLVGISTVFSIFEEKQNRMLIGARNGLYRLNCEGDKREIDHIPTLVDGFNLTGIFRDSLHRYWLCTHNGLLLADSTFANIKKFDFADNIQSNIYNDGSMHHSRNGMLFLGGQNGINYFYPERISMVDRPLSVVIQSVSINDGDSVIFATARRLQLGHQQNTLSFELAAPYFNNAGKVQYRYRLNKGQKNWVNLGASNHFRLNDLPPGKYRLEVAASLSGRTWFDATEPFYFEILPPFWKTWWFTLLAVGLFIAALFGFVRYREKGLRRQQKHDLELEKLRSQALQYELEIAQVVNYFSQSMSNKFTIDDALWDVAQQCIARLGWEDCVIYLLDEDRKVLVQKAAWGQKSTSDYKIINPIEVPLGQGIVGAVAVSGKPELIADTLSDPRYIVDDAARRSELTVPILADGRVIGVIDSEHSQKAFYTPWHLQILTAIAALCSNKVALARVEEAREEVRRQLEEKEKSLLEIEKRSAQIRLLALTNHLNPHFLFNSLTSLNSLIFDNQQLASDFLQHLSKVYRYLLQHKEKETVSLKNELDFVENYIFLLKTRFQDDIRIDIKVANNALEKGIVPVTLQILIENAVKHNVISTQNPLCICVVAEGDSLSVSNNIQRKKQVETSNRQGLESLRSLYHYLSDRPLEVTEANGDFIVKLPLIES